LKLKKIAGDPIDVEVTFVPRGRKVIVPFGTNLLEAAIDADVEVETVCGGNGVCGKCRARVLNGAVSGATPAEEKFFSPEDLKQGHLLMCQRTVLGDVVLEMEAGNREDCGFVPDKGAFMKASLEIDPHVIKAYHELKPPAIDDQTADLDRVLKPLPEGTRVDNRILQTLPGILRASDFFVTSVLLDGEIIALERGDTRADAYGIALDIGTTTVAGYLLDLSSGRVVCSVSGNNRQGVYGSDVISRISHTMKEPDGLLRMKELISRTIDEIVGELTETANVDPERIYVLTLVGNTVMSHFLLGVSAAGIASAPFVPVFTQLPLSTVETLELKNLKPHTRFVLLPNIAGYVGSDTTGVILSTGIHDMPGTWLAIDIGTNGELVLASGGRLLTCSTAAGPAFEGGCIEQGMRAEPGAICEVRMKDDLLLTVMGDTEPRGICGSGLIDTVSEMIRLGLIRENGRIIDPSDCPASLPKSLKSRVKRAPKGYKFVLSEGDREVAITQKDISELQLAKGAIRAGVEILMEELRMKPADLDGVFLAGAFGSKVRRESIRGIGLIPDIPTGRIKSVGNAAGSGAVMALLSKKQIALVSDIAARCEHRELSIHREFTTKFSRALIFEKGLGSPTA